MIDFIAELNAGTKVDQVLINGNKQSVDKFASFDAATGIATFVKENKSIVVVNAAQIDAIVLG